ncbi:DUF669 domain-containing protein [Chimaeribacter californicus]|uniref:DUF669 domain-containing protein n=1 Tax=Chimaeribacter californicus TaxID=2060067 RepID=A0A2N5EE19_9GAMM|nr:DUF669 domain-containing protein [Chimaeribacter californicus]PLR40756.1 DUF669 domain-containing protein [Chimaeribacter californicus]
MSTPIFTYNHEAALTAGQGGFINETGAYVLTITEAALKQADSGARSIEFSGEAEDGRKIQYLSVWVTKKDGTENKFGANIIHAMMGCAGVNQLTSHMQSAGQYVAPEFAGKKIGLVLQKVLSSKQDGSDTYKFDIRLPFIAQTHQTLLEKAEGKNAETVSRMVATLKDKDERKKGVSHADNGYHFGQDDDPGFTPF